MPSGHPSRAHRFLWGWEEQVRVICPRAGGGQRGLDPSWGEARCPGTALWPLPSLSLLPELSEDPILGNQGPPQSSGRTLLVHVDGSPANGGH